LKKAYREISLFYILNIGLVLTYELKEFHHQVFFAFIFIVSQK
jgi:hypothetical protein